MKPAQEEETNHVTNKVAGHEESEKRNYLPIKMPSTKAQRKRMTEEDVVRSQATQSEMDANRRWRINFMDGHNANPVTLAASLYPKPLSFRNEAEFLRFYHKPSGRRKTTLPTKTALDGTPMEPSDIFRALARSFTKEME